ncbi:alpha/beta fold hydrolase [Microlunatus parietis]|uniref:ABC-2 type transport system ATP-binding protein n=1 Tax=Microlunatus parietis TaxID=682979 RepID=A0A7Y9LE04_9ACTN|nr:alpha/beta fold hydrolase [Microlunatus parietis]NYE74462.1 ABC-2 type transport system ATP-binding protein [Microlunatus parietis]
MTGHRPRPGRRGAATRILLALLLTCGLLSVPAAARAEEVVETPIRIAGTPEPASEPAGTDGGPVELDASVFTTRPGEAQPAVVLSHGFNGSKGDSAETARRLAAAGYTVITYTARGFGSSGGLIHLDHPDFEVADLTKIIDYAATLPEVQRTGDNDPVIGLAGVSYGGAVTLFGGADPRVDAIAPAFTWNSLPHALFPQYASDGTQEAPAQVESIDTAGVFKARWASLFFLDTSRPDDPNVPADRSLCGRFSLDLCRAYLETAQTGRPNARLVELLGQSSPQSVLGRISAPTMIIAGEQDTLFPLDHADANLRGLPAGTPARMVWVDGGHDGTIALDPMTAELESWFGRHLKGEQTDPGPAFAVDIPTGRANGADRPTDRLTGAAYPGRGAPAMVTGSLSLDGDAQRMIAPPGGVPAALTSLPGLGPQIASLTGTEAYRIGVLPGQSVTFTSESLDEPLTVVGSARARIRLTPSTTSATLFASIWDLGPDSTSSGAPAPSSAVLPGLAVAPIRLEGLKPGVPTDVMINLPPIAHRYPVNHRAQLVISSTDQAYALPDEAADYELELLDRSLVLPTLTPVEVEPEQRFSVPAWLPITVGVLALAALAAIGIGRLRGFLQARADVERAELRDTPLAVDGLTKSYRDRLTKERVLAVHDVSFTAEPGQVVGLLGPNGAGKTTTIRMLMGLIRPDAGRAYVHGRTVRPGAPVLRSVGALVEGPGFLPHLSGEENLRAYWAATGRPEQEAKFDEVLRIADLGTAAQRRVRGYSHGMRQRLGIAQAMLGLPQVLILDEPVNGLDPPQIKAMRAVLADYAAAGRTVLLSSHLLGEVELTCSHVVMMNRGRVVLAGSVVELTERHDRPLEEVFLRLITP